MKHQTNDAREAFTLIELLVVVAIIFILITIAIPTYQSYQTRAKVTRTLADMRTLQVAVESYQSDNEEYPFRRNTTLEAEVPELEYRLDHLKVLTTPVAYVDYLPQDIFEPHLQSPYNIIDYWDPVQTSWFLEFRQVEDFNKEYSPNDAGWLLVSVGPDNWLGPITSADGYEEFTGVEPPSGAGEDAWLVATIYQPYDPTNGVESAGNIYVGKVGGVANTAEKLQGRIFGSEDPYKEE